MPRRGWQLCRGISGSFRLESVAGLRWNQWQLSCGTGGSVAVESVAGFTWNRWQLWRGIRTCQHWPLHTRRLTHQAVHEPVRSRKHDLFPGEMLQAMGFLPPLSCPGSTVRRHVRCRLIQPGFRGFGRLFPALLFCRGLSVSTLPTIFHRRLRVPYPKTDIHIGITGIKFI